MNKEKVLKKSKEIYIATAIILVNTLVLILIFNLFFHFANPTLRQMFVFSELTYSDELLDEIYPHIKPDTRDELLEENTKHAIPFTYDSFTGYSIKPYNGTFVTFDENGFRHIRNQCSYPIDKEKYNIFIFGGSTTFGVGNMDNETIPSYMQEDLRLKYDTEKICIYNFARPLYYSSTERVLFNKLIVEKNQVPDYAIFIDGLNEYVGEQVPYEDLMKRLFDKKDKIEYLFSNTAIAIVYNHIYRRFVLSNRIEYISEDSNLPFTRYFSNKKVIESVANTYGVNTSFVIQPVSAYNYECSSHFLCKRGLIEFNISRWDIIQGYYSLFSESEQIKNREVIWLGDIQEGRKDNLYVDFGHYTASFSKELAEKIILETNINFTKKQWEVNHNGKHNSK